MDIFDLIKTKYIKRTDERKTGMAAIGDYFVRIVKWKMDQNSKKIKVRNCLNLNGLQIDLWNIQVLTIDRWIQLKWILWWSVGWIGWITGTVLVFVFIESNGKLFKKNFMQKEFHTNCCISEIAIETFSWNFLGFFFNKLHNMDKNTGHNAIWFHLRGS